MYRFYLGTPGTPGTVYSRGKYFTLPTGDDDLQTIYSAQELSDVSLKDTIRVAQTGNQQYMVHQFKNSVGTNTTCFLEWYGQSDLATSASTIYLQIYNRSTLAWDTVASNSSTGANTDIDLTATVSNLTNYKTGTNMVSCRVYQQGT